MLPKKHLPTLILSILVYTSYLLFSWHPQPAELNILGAETNLLLYQQPESGQQPMLVPEN